MAFPSWTLPPPTSTALGAAGGAAADGATWRFRRTFDAGTVVSTRIDGHRAQAAADASARSRLPARERFACSRTLCGGHPAAARAGPPCAHHDGRGRHGVALAAPRAARSGAHGVRARGTRAPPSPSPLQTYRACNRSPDVPHTQPLHRWRISSADMPMCLCRRTYWPRRSPTTSSWSTHVQHQRRTAAAPWHGSPPEPWWPSGPRHRPPSVRSRHCALPPGPHRELKPSADTHTHTH